jgi:hypothetical protein
VKSRRAAVIDVPGALAIDCVIGRAVAVVIAGNRLRICETKFELFDLVRGDVLNKPYASTKDGQISPPVAGVVCGNKEVIFVSKISSL